MKKSALFVTISILWILIPAQDSWASGLATPSPVDDFLLSEDQLDELRRQNKSRYRFRRWKRSGNSRRNPLRRWKMPIRYKFDGQHSSGQRQVIREALQHWMDQTCVRFQEISATESYTDHHIIFTRQPLGCFSFTGMAKVIPQQVNLDDECLEVFGKPVHEIGHVLGLWHEHQRSDRDDSVKVIDENIGTFRFQFRKHWEVPREIPYEFGSVMHYSAKDGSSNGELTLRARNPLYQGNMGQRTGLSFTDALYTNTMYCTDVCSGHLERPCSNGGYRDPKSCIRCRCPDGFSGDFCDDIDIGSCGGVYDVTINGNVTIMSPGYDVRAPYDHLTRCTWLFKCSGGSRLQFRFVEEFGVFRVDQSCYHWVEVRYGEDLSKEGPRFCGHSVPDEVLLSSSDVGQLLVLFRSNYAVSRSPRDLPHLFPLRGFKAVVTAHAPKPV